VTEDVKWYGEEFERELDKIIKAKLLKIIYRLERIIQGLFRTPKSGRVYKRGGRTHKAAGPEEPPAIDTAALSKSITHADPMKQGDVWSIDFGVSQEGGRAQIAEHLEYGTSKMAEHPFFRPALAQLQQEVDQDLAGEG